MILFFREDFHYDNGNKTGKAVLRGASGAIREGNDFFQAARSCRKPRFFVVILSDLHTVVGN